MRNLKALPVIVIGTFILLIIGLYNGFPLVYSDTGTYIYSGFDRFVPVDRPISYGLFIKFFSFSYSMWFIIIVQNLITAFVIFEVFKTLNFNKTRLNFFYLSVVLFLVLFTGIGWYSNQIMPDFFAPIFILIIFILVKREGLSLFVRILLSLILVFSLISHFSHLMIASVLMVFLVLLKYFSRKYFSHFSIKKILSVSSLVLSGWIILPGINYMVEKKVFLSKGSHVFLMAHLNDTGVLEKFLKEKCSNDKFRDCKLCNYKDSLPDDLASFIWGSGILENTGGWENSKAEYNKIISSNLLFPKYFLLNVQKSVSYGFVQLTKNEIGQGLSAYTKGSAPYGQIHWRFRDELYNYLNSRQNKWNGVNLKLETLNTVHLLLLMLSLFILIGLFSTSLQLKMDTLTMSFLLFILLAIVINSFITAGLNSPCERFQARVVWMFPFALIMVISENYDICKQAIYTKLKRK